MTKSDLSASEWKQKGNEEFAKNNFDEALSCYTNALNLAKEENSEKAIYYKNRAAVYLKKKDYDKTIKDCEEALKICPTDPKTLYRRCLALKSLERFEEAYRDARQIITSDPGNKDIQPIAAELHTIVQDRLRERSKTSSKVIIKKLDKIDAASKVKFYKTDFLIHFDYFQVAQMFEIAFDLSKDKEHRETAMNNILVLARETAGAEVMFKEGVITRISKLLKVEKIEEIKVSAIRIIDELCKSNVYRTDEILRDIGIPWFLEMINSKNKERVSAAQHCMQVCPIHSNFFIHIVFVKMIYLFS